MDEFLALLARDFGIRPQGKAAPIAAAKDASSFHGTSNLNIWNSNSVGGSFLDGHDGLFGSTATRKTQGYGGGGYDDVFGGTPKHDNNPTETRGGASFDDDDSIFQSKDSSSKSSSLPVFDNPKYDDDGDIFNGLQGMKGSSSATVNNDDDVFSGIGSPSKQSAAFDDLLGSFRRKDSDSKSSSGRRSEQEVVKGGASDFDDLIPGFGRTSPPKNRATSEMNQPWQSTVAPTKSTASILDDPFVALESTPSSTYPPSDIFNDTLEQMNKPSNSGNKKFGGSTHNGMVSDDMDPLDSLGKTVPMFSAEMNEEGREKIPSMDADAVWLMVSEIPLLIQPRSAPPPSHPPPPKPAQVLKGDKGSFAPKSTTKKVNPTFPYSTKNFQSPRTVTDSAKRSGVSSIDELEVFAMGGYRSNGDEHADSLSSEEDIETNSAAAAASMKEAKDRAEAKIKHAREVREREIARAARSTEAVQHDAQEREIREKQERLDHEREEKEREQRRIERERERAQAIEMEKGRRAVECATREARGRAAAEARLKAERAQAEALKHVPVQRAQTEAQERAAAEARDRAAAEAREREARETQWDQAERSRIAETLDIEIKCWAAGKAGNLLALLSTLQYVLWPECGWQSVSLADLMTPASVKKVYRKATLCIHPDKVQQKDANLQQKYIAEKVFHLLKEAWTKFNNKVEEPTPS